MQRPYVADRSTDKHEAALQREFGCRKPTWLGHAIGVGEREILPASVVRTQVPRDSSPQWTATAHELDRRKRFYDFDNGWIVGAVYDDHLERRLNVLPLKAMQAVDQLRGMTSARDNH
jgi:hypothetical protein